MDTEIRKHMEDPAGDSWVGVCSFGSGGRFISLLFNPTVLVSAVTLQQAGDRVYIKNVDTTGCERGHTRGLILAVLKTLGPRMTCCFSSPRDEYIFNGSSRNRMKRIRGAGDLLEYWVEIFGMFHDKVHVWSNYYENISHPFKSVDELVYFDDDPKEKLVRHFDGGVEDMFGTLLCRTDFVKGSLVYGVSVDGGCSSQAEARELDVWRVETRLRTLDFSTPEDARESTARLVDEFAMEIEYFKVKKTTVSRGEDQVCMVDVRKK